MKTFRIDSFDSVSDFLFELYNRSEIIFDPADDITTLTNKNGASLFPEDESGYLNHVMLECFVFCVLNDLNIYTLVTMVQYDITQINAAA